MSTVAEIFPVSRQLGLIGVEVEMEGQMFVTPKGWNGKIDHSLRGNGIEWYFIRPCSLDLAKRRVQRLYEFNRNSGAVFQPSPRCGVHVHFNCQSLTPNQVYSLALLWYIFEGLLVRWCGTHREGNPFCLRATDANDVVVVLARGLRGIDQFHSLVDAWERYSGLNLQSLQRLGSVEFRTLGAPDNPEKIIKWLEILHTLYHFAIGVENVARFIENLSQTGWMNVLEPIFGKLTEEFMFPDAEMLIMRSLRAVQFAIYATELPKVKKKVVPQETAPGRPVPRTLDEILSDRHEQLQRLRIRGNDIRVNRTTTDGT